MYSNTQSCQYAKKKEIYSEGLTERGKNPKIPECNFSRVEHTGGLWGVGVVPRWDLSVSPQVSHCALLSVCSRGQPGSCCLSLAIHRFTPPAIPLLRYFDSVVFSHYYNIA
jgi:hypothetical protein